MRSTATPDRYAGAQRRVDVPIHLEDGFLVTEDVWNGASLSVGIQSDRMTECVERIRRDRVTSVFGSPLFGFHGRDLDFLRDMPWVESVWFWEVKLKSIDGLYALGRLRYFGVSPTRPGIDFSRFPQLRGAVVEPRAKDHGLDACAELKRLHVWRHPSKGKPFSLALPTGVDDLRLLWSSLTSLDDLPALPLLRKLWVARCRNLESLGDLGARFPKLEHLVITACGRVRDGEGRRVSRDLPHLTHAWVRNEKVV